MHELLHEGTATAYPASMTAAWTLSVTSLADRLPVAVDMLRLLAFLGPEPIPRDLFRSSSAGLAGPLDDPIMLSRTIGELARFALVRIDQQGRTLHVHRLIQALMRDGIPVAEHQRIRDHAHRLLAEYVPLDPDNPAGWPEYAAVLSHIQASGMGDNRDPAIRRTVLHSVRYLHATGDYAAARAMASDLVDAWSADSGVDEPEVLRARLLLADILRALGQHTAAHELDTEALARLPRPRTRQRWHGSSASSVSTIPESRER